MSVIDRDSKIEDMLHYPLGRDLMDRVLYQMGLSYRLIDNPLVRHLSIKTLMRLTRSKLNESFWESLLTLINRETDVPTDQYLNPQKRWWKEAVFYQIYPRSFCDGNGDGIGDLQGIINKLDYLYELGIDALWLSPVYDSPNIDNGYDIRDYYMISPDMGTMEDFDRLLSEVHKRGMRLIMDLVVNHTSDEHAWFKAALEHPEGPYGSYYFLRSADAGKVPNNWESFFGGSAWRWFPEQKFYGLHLFADKQMDLNWDYEPVRRDVQKMVRWWLAKGVDGFRLDVINYVSKTQGLPDGNEVIAALTAYKGIEHYFYGPNLHRYMRELRKEAFEPYGAFSVGEGPGIGIETGRMLTGEDRKELDLIFLFDHLENPGKQRFQDYLYDLNGLKKHYIHYHNRLNGNDWISVFLENHDNPRMWSKVNPDPRWRGRLARLLLSIQLTMKGTAFIYQGQELAAGNQDFTDIRQFRDVESLNKYAELLPHLGAAQALAVVKAGSRDHARVPMRWDRSPNSGFSSVEPWLPFVGEDAGYSVEEELEDEHSVLHYFRHLLELRKKYAALRLGEIRFVAAKKHNYLAYFREYKGERIFCEFNLCTHRIRRPFLSKKYKGILRSYQHEKKRRMDSLGLWMEPYEASIYKV